MASAPSRITREQGRANTRERLLVAARSVFARSGFHGASVEQIAAEAGFSTGALYSNFDGKEDLFLVLMEREIDEHAREIAEAVRARSSMSERAAGGGRAGRGGRGGRGGRESHDPRAEQGEHAGAVAGCCAERVRAQRLPRSVGR